MTLIQEEEDARRITSNQFVMFSTSPATVEISCKDESTYSKTGRRRSPSGHPPHQLHCRNQLAVHAADGGNIGGHGEQGRHDPLPSLHQQGGQRNRDGARKDQETAGEGHHPRSPHPGPRLADPAHRSDRRGNRSGRWSKHRPGDGRYGFALIAAAGLFCYCSRRRKNKALQKQPVPATQQPDRPQLGVSHSQLPRPPAALRLPGCHTLPQPQPTHLFPPATHAIVPRPVTSGRGSREAIQVDRGGRGRVQDQARTWTNEQTNTNTTNFIPPTNYGRDRQVHNELYNLEISRNTFHTFGTHPTETPSFRSHHSKTRNTHNPPQKPTSRKINKNKQREVIIRTH